MPKPFITLHGDKELAAIIRTLPDKVQRKLLRRAVTKGSTPVLRRAKQLAPRRSGLLRRSLKRKIKTYKGGVVVAVIGPDKNVSGVVGKRKHTPGKIAHLVEYGHGGKHPAPPHAFLEPALESTKAQAVAIMEDTLRQGIISEASKG